MTRIGIVGGGNISATHARAAASIPGVRVAAIFGSNHDKITALAREFNAVAYDDFDSFLAQPIDVVCIGSPSGLHAGQGIAAARRGIHVLVEKPIDISAARADALIEAAETAGVKLGVFFQDRFKPELAHLKKWLDGGGLGKLHLADGRVKWYRPPDYYANSRWRGTWALDGGGAVINQGIHTVDLLLWLAGDVAAAQAQTRTAVHNIEAEDTAVALLEFKNGAIGTFEAATSAFPGHPRRVELSGANGTVIVETDRVISSDLRNGDYPALVTEADRNPSATSPAVSDIRGHRAAIEDFLSAVEHNREPRCGGREARRSIALVEAIYASARSGMRVTL